MNPSALLRHARLVVVSAGLLCLPAVASAQEGCEAVPPGNDIVRSLTVGGLQITYITRPHFLCAGGVEIFADSAEAFPDRGMSHLIGNVRYVESARTMTADDARYFTNEGRLQANGNVQILDEEQGSSITNGDLVYLLETDFRDLAEMTVVTGADGIRPVAVLTPPPPEPDTLPVAPDTAGPPPTEPPGPPPTYTVVGDRIFLLGTGYFTADGSVEIRQDSLQAFADSAEYDADGAGLNLTGDARVVSAEYDLIGRSITMTSPGGPQSRVHALREAQLEGTDLLLTSAQIFLFLEDSALERLVATPIVGPAAINADSVDHERPRADVDDFILTADSLEVRAPGQTMERVFASGTARSVSQSGDSLNVELLPEIARSDWLEGDTVIVTFAADGPAPSAAPGEESSARLEVDAIRAIGNARSLYRLAPNDSTARPGIDPPAVHYVVGSEIEIQMEDREVQGMNVQGQTQGIHMEPLARRVPVDSVALPDSAVTVDTMGVAVDTLAALLVPPTMEPDDPRRVRFSTPTQPRPDRQPYSWAPMESAPWIRPWIR